MRGRGDGGVGEADPDIVGVGAENSGVGGGPDECGGAMGDEAAE